MTTLIIDQITANANKQFATQAMTQAITILAEAGLLRCDTTEALGALKLDDLEFRTEGKKVGNAAKATKTKKDKSPSSDDEDKSKKPSRKNGNAMWKSNAATKAGCQDRLKTANATGDEIKAAGMYARMWGELDASEKEIWKTKATEANEASVVTASEDE